MKRPKALAWRHKQALSAYSLNPDDWRLVSEGSVYLKIIHKRTNEIRSVDKFARAVGGRCS